MKQILCLLFIICCSPIFGQNLIDYTNDFGLLGDVKKVEEKSYSLIFIAILNANGKLPEQSKLRDHKILSFNSKNMLVKEYEKREFNDVIKCQYIYDVNDSLIDIKYNHQFSLNRRLNKSSKYFEKELMTYKGILQSYKSTSLPSKNSYDSKDRILKVYYQNRAYNNTKISNCNFSYDGNNLKSIDCYDNNDKLFSNRVFFYNKKNKISKEIYQIFNNQKLTKKTISFFNEKGIINKKNIQKYKNDIIHYIKDEIYVDHKNLSTVITYPLDNEIITEINKYDSKLNLLSSKITNKTGDSIMYRNSKVYSYDEYGNITGYKKTSFVPKTDTSIDEKFKYKYDKNGNWIIKCKCIDENPVKVILRKIDYHNSSSNEIVNKRDAIFFCDPNYEKRLKELKIEMENNYKNSSLDFEDEEEN